jgi:superoxide dismutase, Fe-Mn family
MKNLSRRDFLKGSALGLAATLGLGSLQSCSKIQAPSSIISYNSDPSLYPVYLDGKYIQKNFSRLITDRNLGLSEEILRNHLGLYSNYVNNVNEAEAKIQSGIVDEFTMKHLAFSLNGMALHDIYFSNMSSETSSPSKELKQLVEESFGSFESYMKNLTTIASQVSGWSLTCFNLLNKKLLNYGLNDHSANFPNFVIPILALDVYEHAYVADFGENGKEDYMAVFSRIIDWDLVARRLSSLQV